MWKRVLLDKLPTCSVNLKSDVNFERLAELLTQSVKKPCVLVIGGGTGGIGIDTLMNNPDIECVCTDVALMPHVSLIVDAHDIPFENGTFDGVVATAVLEHVLDPARCVEEMHRVLKRKGLVYAETPFMAQVHAGQYDFQRFTDLGHRWLFRSFEEIERGISAGPGTALLWSLNAFLRTLFRRHTAKQAATASLQATLFWLKYIDYWFVNRPSALDCAMAYYFLGRSKETAITERELLDLYRGACDRVRA